MHSCEPVLEYDKLVDWPERLKERPDLRLLHRPRDLAHEELDGVVVLPLRRHGGGGAGGGGAVVAGAGVGSGVAPHDVLEVLLLLRLQVHERRRHRHGGKGHLVVVVALLLLLLLPPFVPRDEGRGLLVVEAGRGRQHHF